MNEKIKTTRQVKPETTNRFPLNHAARTPRTKASKPAMAEPVALRIAGKAIRDRVT